MGCHHFGQPEKNTFIGCVEYRANFYKKHYLTLAANLLLHSDEFNRFSTYKSIIGGGVTYSYKSPFGPVEFTLGYSDVYRKLTTSVNIGFWF